MRTLPIAALLALLSACDGASTDDTGPFDPDDADGDGVPASEDCDDHDPEVGAPGTWYRDADADGFGNPDRSEEGCDRPSGFVDNAIDCDDTNPSMPILVDPDHGSDTNTGGPGDPLETLGAALATGVACIALEAGTYTGTWTLDRTVRIGAVGGSDDTVLDANGQGAVFEVQAGSPVLWGLTFRGGSGVDVEGDLLGGAVYAWDAQGLWIEDCVFRGNTAEYGAAVFGPMQGVLTARDTTFADNTAATSGGAVYAVAADVEGSTFEGNTARYGGGAFFMGGIVAATGAVFRGNSAVIVNDSGGKGGGAWLDANGTLEGGTFEGNTAEAEGGGLYTRKTGDASDGVPTVREVTITGNEAESGGGISCEGALALFDATITGNTASQDGGGIFSTGDLDVSDTLVSDNLAQMGGGMLLQETAGTFTGVDVLANTGGVNGGGLYLYYASLDLGDTLISGNEAPFGAGVDLHGGTVTAAAATVSDNVAGDGGGGIYVYSAATWTGGTVEGNEAPDGAGIFADAYGTTFTDLTVSSNVAGGSGGGVYAEEDVTFEQVVFLGNSAGVYGAGIAVAGGEVVLDDCAVLRSAAGNKGGGARLAKGTLRSQASDWGEGGEDNSPDDVHDGVTAYSDFGDAESFTCTARTGCH
jgi:predicted outer membrane repeat protein